MYGKHLSTTDGFYISGSSYNAVWIDVAKGDKEYCKEILEGASIYAKNKQFMPFTYSVEQTKVHLDLLKLSLGKKISETFKGQTSVAERGWREPVSEVGYHRQN